jgi:hypothetical protein
MAYFHSRTVEMPFDEAVEKVTESLKSQGFGVLTEINVNEVFAKKLGIEFRKYKILGACNPQYAGSTDIPVCDFDPQTPEGGCYLIIRRGGFVTRPVARHSGKFARIYPESRLPQNLPRLNLPKDSNLRKVYGMVA